MSDEKILCVRELKWEGGVLKQRLLIRRDGVDVEEWRDVEQYGVVHGRSIEFWRNIDWNRPNVVIAKELNYSIAYISQKRTAFGSRTYKHSRINWDGADWSQSNSEIAKAFGTSIQTVASARHARGVAPYAPKGRSNRKIDPALLDAVDWEWEKDATIATRLGVSRERIRQLRIDLQKPECRVKWSGSGSESLKWLLQNREKITGMSGYDIVRMMPGNVQLPTKYNLLRRSGIPFTKTRHWKYSDEGSHPMNWSIPTKWLGLIWGVPAHSVSICRMNMNAGPSKWRGGGFSRYVDNPDFVAMLNAEIEVARSKGMTVDTDKIKGEIEFQRKAVAETWQKKMAAHKSNQTI